ncbi:MAG TPA: transglycosylase SLT domain-containing protein [Anaerolineae bacterium]
MTRHATDNDFERRGNPVPLGLLAAILVLALAIAAAIVWQRGDYLRTPAELYRAAAAARSPRAATFYTRLGERAPEIKEYAELWKAEASLPDLAALQTVQAVIALRPQSPAAYEAHVTLARYYAGQAAPAAAEEYRAALALDDTTALRLELARHLEAFGDAQGAYAEYLRLLNKLPDAFEGLRRTGHDPLALARDLIAATYDSDALDVLRDSADPKAWPLRAKALADLGRDGEAEIAYRQWLAQAPADADAKTGLAGVLVHLGRPDDALALYATVDTPDGRLAQADLLADRKPDQALALYQASPYPLAWWSATAILESRGRLTETLPLYRRVAASDSPYADDAAYRLTVLGRRLGDANAEAAGKAQLAKLGLNWLAVRAAGRPLQLEIAPPLAPGGQEILAKAKMLAAIGRTDLAQLELVLAARPTNPPETQAAALQALAASGQVAQAQNLAAAHLTDHPYAARTFWELSYPKAYSATVQAQTAQFAVDPLLVWAVMRAESRFEPEALSYAGARGLLQVMPDTQSWIAEQLGEDIPPGAAYTPEANIHLGTWYLHYLLKLFGGDVELAIAAYNGGPGSVGNWIKDPRVKNRDDLIRWIGFGQTREYLERVGINYLVYQALYGATP